MTQIKGTPEAVRKVRERTARVTRTNRALNGAIKHACFYDRYLTDDEVVKLKAFIES